VYFAESHTDVFRKIVNGQLARKEREYPVAVAGINLTQKLYEILKVNDEGGEGTIFPILFSHKHAFEEMYCSSFQVLDYTWDDMNASYMDFPKVIAAVHKQIVEVVEARPLTLEQFHFAACCKGQQITMEGDETDGEEPEAVKKLRTQVKKENLELVKQNKLSYLVDGCTFKVLKAQQKGKNVPQQYLFAKLSENHQELGYGPIPDTSEVPNSLPNIIKVGELSGVVVGQEVPSFNKKKVSEDMATLSFAIVLKDDKGCVEFMANTRDEFVNWTDGLRALMGKPMECAETLDEAKTLVTLEMKVRLLDLEGIELPKETPSIPEPPPDFDFVELRSGKLAEVNG